MVGKATRERILDAALEEFDERGYEATTVASICRRAGVSNGSFFHWSAISGASSLTPS